MKQDFEGEKMNANKETCITYAEFFGANLNEPVAICAGIKNDNDTCMDSNQSDHLLTDFTDES
jgi:hypothetical protein